MSEAHKAELPAPMPMLQVLANLRQGSIVHELQGDLTKVSKAVSLLGKGGKVTLVIEVSPVKNVPGAVYLSAQISSKIPKPARGADLLYTDATGGLHRNDPRQMDAFDELMKPRLVGSGTVNTATGEILDSEGASA
jgi:hypothetical protein